MQRFKTIEAQGRKPAYPTNPAPHVIEWLFEIGPVASGGMSDSPIGWQEIAAWEHLTGIELDAWEAKTLRRLSRAFVYQRGDARKSGCPAPYTDDQGGDSRATESAWKALAQAARRQSRSKG